MRRSLLLLATAGAFVHAVPASATQTCAGQGAGGTVGTDEDAWEWGVQFTAVAGISCANATRTLTTQCTEDGMPGWDFVVDGGRLVARSGAKLIAGDMAGGSPPCLNADAVTARVVHFAENGTYAPVAGRQQKAMTRAARTKSTYGLGGVARPFAWYVGTTDARYGVVCGFKKGLLTGAAVIRKKGRWRLWTDAPSGAIQSAQLNCGVYDE